jgi:hypothetical protein
MGSIHEKWGKQGIKSTVQKTLVYKIRLNQEGKASLCSTAPEKEHS